MKQLFTGCARLNLSRVEGLSGFIYKVCYILFNGVLYLFVDGELRFEPSSLRLPTLPVELTCETAWGRSCLKAPVSVFLRHRYEKVSGFCTGTDTSSLHKMAVWSDDCPWCSFIEMKMLSLCLENTKSSRWP